jgi:hypothetical protein
VPNLVIKGALVGHSQGRRKRTDTLFKIVPAAGQLRADEAEVALNALTNEKYLECRRPCLVRLIHGKPGVFDFLVEHRFSQPTLISLDKFKEGGRPFVQPQIGAEGILKKGGIISTELKRW